MTQSDLEKFCSGLKGTTRDIKWGNDLCYSVGKKMYCATSLKGDPTISFKATPEEFAELTERDGIIPAPYAARYHWVMVQKSKSLSPKGWKSYIKKNKGFPVRKHLMGDNIHGRDQLLFRQS
jgi:predicted DNA-binding protein (MmcQ/YjbR family)